MDVKQEIEIKEELLEDFMEEEEEGNKKDLIEDTLPQSQQSQVCERKFKLLYFENLLDFVKLFVAIGKFWKQNMKNILCL